MGKKNLGSVLLLPCPKKGGCTNKTLFGVRRNHVEITSMRGRGFSRRVYQPKGVERNTHFSVLAGWVRILKKDAPKWSYEGRVWREAAGELGGKEPGCRQSVTRWSTPQVCLASFTRVPFGTRLSTHDQMSSM